MGNGIGRCRGRGGIDLCGIDLVDLFGQSCIQFRARGKLCGKEKDQDCLENKSEALRSNVKRICYALLQIYGPVIFILPIPPILSYSAYLIINSLISYHDHTPLVLLMYGNKVFLSSATIITKTHFHCSEHYRQPPISSVNLLLFQFYQVQQPSNLSRRT
jgi:hypothetical protein